METRTQYRTLSVADGAEVLQAPALAKVPGLYHGFATRRGGVSQGSRASLNFGLKGGDLPQNVARNLERLGRTLGFAPALAFRLTQVHGRQVVEVADADEPARVQGLQADALVTALSGRTLGVVTADCVPVLLVDAARGVVAAAHAGWRGIAAGVLRAVVETLAARFGSRPADLLAASGPCIGPCCYEVGPEVASQFSGIPGAVQPGEPRPHLDLPAAAAHSLAALGVEVQHAGVCTRCDGERFFSYRRDGDATGHHLSVIGLAQ